MCVCVCVCVCAHVCVYVHVHVCVCVLNLHVKVFLKALVYMILWFNYNVMDVISMDMFYLVIISDAANECFSGDNKGLLN